MNVLFLSLIDYSSINNRDIYSDLLRIFIKNNHKVYLLSPAEKRTKSRTGLIVEENCKILKIKTGNIQKTNIIEKGISTIRIEFQFVSAIKKYFSDIKFDLILYCTPPITLVKPIKYIKKRDNAISYLMLKDIFPQNAVDIGMMSKKGLTGILYKYFRKKEKKLYKLSDVIGCMSQANIDYILKNNKEINKEKVVLCPNCIDVIDLSVSKEQKDNVRRKYYIPQNKVVFLYGGNLGKPQGIDFFIKCLERLKNNSQIFFIIIGSGTEYYKIDNYINNSKPNNIKLINKLSKDEYSKIVGSCDVGLLFLDFRFTIPNFPSRIVDYMQAKLPVLACTDEVSDIGEIIEKEKFGWRCFSNNVGDFCKIIYKILDEDIEKKGKNAFDYLLNNWNVEKQYKDIITQINRIRAKGEYSL